MNPLKDYTDAALPSLADLDQPILLINSQELLPTIDYDLQKTRTLDCWVYSTDAQFFRIVFGPALLNCQIRVVADYHHRTDWRDLALEFPRLSVRTWATNRTMHDKTFILHGADTAYLITANMNRGSFLLSLNRAARVRNLEFIQRLSERFEAEWGRCTPLAPRQTPR